MDGMHDLGGKQGFGPIPIGDNQGFRHDWERRMWALSRCAPMPEGMKIDWFRHGIERMVPTDYLTLPYFEKWCVNYLMLYLDGNMVSLDEVLAGHPDTRANAPPGATVAEVVSGYRANVVDYSVPTEIPPRFSVGDSVTTKRRISANHTRLPAYARNCAGTVITWHGAHLLPDKGAQGIDVGEHLYTVSFAATELWGPDANQRDSVTLELWESYFV